MSSSSSAAPPPPPLQDVHGKGQQLLVESRQQWDRFINEANATRDGTLAPTLTVGQTQHLYHWAAFVRLLRAHDADVAAAATTRERD
jgi:hypothetical protein